LCINKEVQVHVEGRDHARQATDTCLQIRQQQQQRNGNTNAKKNVLGHALCNLIEKCDTHAPIDHKPKARFSAVSVSVRSKSESQSQSSDQTGADQLLVHCVSVCVSLWHDCMRASSATAIN